MRNKLQEHQLKQSARSISVHRVAVTVVVVLVVAAAAAAAAIKKKKTYSNIKINIYFKGLDSSQLKS